MTDDMNFLLERNRTFARTDAKARAPQIPFVPNEQLYVITCVDPRVDPADILGLQLGDAIVARNVGGRITPALLQDLAWISYLHETKTPDADWFQIAVIHHTDCGSGLFADDNLRHAFAARGFNESELSGLAVLDPAQTVRTDVATLLTYPNLSPRVRVSGYAYDIVTGLLTEVVPARARADADTTVG
ncbi:MAG: carbonic anhydrase [Pseudonocardiales bacterium]|nr:carbonic anhydrase [Pseudonocardiales bacterium]